MFFDFFIKITRKNVLSKGWVLLGEFVVYNHELTFNNANDHPINNELEAIRNYALPGNKKNVRNRPPAIQQFHQFLPTHPSSQKETHLRRTPHPSQPPSPPKRPRRTQPFNRTHMVRRENRGINANNKIKKQDASKETSCYYSLIINQLSSLVLELAYSRQRGKY